MNDELNVTAMFEKHHDIVRQRLMKAFGSEDDNVAEQCLRKAGVESLTKEQLEIIKGLVSDNPFTRLSAEGSLEKADMTDLEKSHILDIVSYSEEFKIKKSGKQIKENIRNLLMPELQAELTKAKGEADALLKLCGTAPTQDCYPWWTGGMGLDIGYKMYKWDETRYCDKAATSVSNCIDWEERPIPINVPETKEEAISRTKYNEAVEHIGMTMADIRACEILENNLEDGAQIRLTPKQLLAFKFE